MVTQNIIEKAFFLKTTTLFSELDIDLILSIAEKAEERFLSENAVIFSKGDNAEYLYVLSEGNVEIVVDESTPPVILYPPEFFGEEALFSQTERAYTAKTGAATRLLAISRPYLSHIILEAPVIAMSLLREYTITTPFRKR